MVQSGQIKSIGIIGGGSAGYLSALYLKDAFREMDVSVIESSRIPVIGVGEATTPLLRDFLHRKMRFPLKEFYRETKPTLKLGIKFVWGKSGDYSYNSPFGRTDMANALYHTGRFNDLAFPSLLMDEDKAPFMQCGDHVTPINLAGGYAYHVDNQRFLQYLRKKVIALGCHYIDAELDEVTLTPGGDSIQSLGSTDRSVYQFDLYVDCSGFRSMLLGKALRTPWIDYAASLKTNRAIIGTVPNEGEISPYTTSRTLKSGWLWNTPMQHEDHLGYVFSREHSSDDEAFIELKSHCKTINNERVITFRPGRYAASWRGNVVGVGNSFAFIEPLESTGLHMILRQLKVLTKGLQRDNAIPEAAEEYNETTNRRWDELKWFVALHFKYNKRLDTQFWRWCHTELDLSGLEEYIDYYMDRGPLSYDKHHPLAEKLAKDATFSLFLYDATLAGCGLNEDFFRRRNELVSDQWPKHHDLDRKLASQCIGHREALEHMEEHEYEFDVADGSKA